VPITVTVTATDLTDGQVGTLTVTQSIPVILTIPNMTLPQAGGTFTLNVGGGTQSSYDITTTLGTLSTQQVLFNSQGPTTFMLTLPANTSMQPLTITVTATDIHTGDTATLTLTQQ
jgi:hypothetical protein